MNIVVCDDDINCINRLTQLIQQYSEKEEFNIYTYLSGEEFLEQVKKEMKFDIVFLDIEMAEISGIDVARYLREKDDKSIIFFVTSHLNYVSDTFRLGAFQFLVKPVDEKAFQCDFERAVRTYKNTHKFYQIRWRDINTIIEYGDIYYVEAYNRHLYVHTASMEYMCVGTLTEEEKRLKPYDFVRCHQGFLVNMHKIKEINKTEIILNNGIRMPIGRRFREGVLVAFNLFLAGKLV